MGYTTEFTGHFRLDRKLAPEHDAYLRAFNTSRRIKRDAKKASTQKDMLRTAVGLPVGPEGAYVVLGADYGEGYNSSKDPSVVDNNATPEGQPGFWCQWSPTDDGAGIAWDGGEKFYMYAEWLAYLIEHFLDPWGYSVRGAVSWQGEEDGDTGVLLSLNNRLVVVENKDAWRAGDVPERMLFRGVLARKLETAARLGGAKAALDLLGLRGWHLPR